MLDNSLLGELAPYSPLNREESGGCVFCGGHPPGDRFGRADRLLSDHSSDCPWVRGRAAQGEQLPLSREAAFDMLQSKLPLARADRQTLTVAQEALLSWLLHRGLAESTETHFAPSDAGREWLVRPTGLRAVLEGFSQPGIVAAVMAGRPVLAPLRERGQALLPGATLIARPRGQQSWGLEPL